jgi:hypothetical protein
MSNGTRVRWWGAAIAGVALLSGCGDRVGSPIAPEGPRRLSGPGGSWNGESYYVGTQVFTVRSDGGTFKLAGGHQITFQRDAICEPGTSGYGPDTWDLPCRPARTNIVVTATTWRDADGHPRVDFAPDLRFTSLRDGGSKVLLQLKDPHADDPTAAVFYCPTLGECYDESVSDSGVKSRRDPRQGWVYRYIKHFSGYNVTAGRAAETSVEEAALEY